MNHLKKFSIGAAFALLLPLTALYSQTQPVLQAIKFLNNGDEISETSQAAIVIQLEFDQAMNTAAPLTISTGLEEPYDINLDFSGQVWVGNQIWQGQLTITDEVPPEDGTYIFKISGAQNANNVAMDTTLSTDVGNKTLRICRSGQIFAQLGTINYPTISAGAYKDTLLVLQNLGCGDADLIVSLGLPSFPFSVVDYNNNPFVIGGEGQVGLVVRFYPSQRGSYADNLVINSTDPDQPTLTIPLSGIAVAPEIETNPLASIDFGSVDAGVSYSDTVFVYNLEALNEIWDANLIVSTQVIGTGSSAFTVQTSGFALSPGDSFKVAVTFFSNVRAAYSATLRLTTNDPDEPIKDILLYANSTDLTPPPQPINVSGSWYLNYYPFWINTGQICIYWTNPNDPSGISEVRWRFGAPPTGPNDTTNTLKSVNVNSFCYQIPLLYQDGGYYTVYYWLVDGLGNGGWQFNYRSFSFSYDDEWPGLPLNVSISNTNWTNASSLNVFWTNPGASAGDFYEVRWKLKNRPTSNDDITGNKLLAPPFTGQQFFTANFDSRFCGNDTLFFWLADSAGNADFQNPAFVQYKYDACRPVITRVLDDEVVAIKQTAFQDTILITDHSYVDSAWVAYRFGGAEAVIAGFAFSLSRVSGSQNKFLLSISKDAVTTRGLEYIIIARDSLGNRYAHGPGDDCYYDDDEYGDDYYYDGYVPFAEDEGAWHSVQVRGDSTTGEYRVDTNNNPVLLPAGTDQLSYNLVSVPFILNDGRASTVLVDDLGAADSTEWRFFEYVTADQQWQEYPNTSNFEPGRAFFLIVSDAGKYIRSGAGTTVATVCPDTIALQPGWNLIGNPFNFNVDNLESLIPINFLNQLTVYSYEKIGWNINLPKGIEPWRGYAVYVQPLIPELPIYLLVIPKAINEQSSKAAAATAAPDEWTMQITASAGSAKDVINWMGVRKNAAAEYDANDLFEPPVIGKYVSLYFPHKEWTTLPQNYTADYRPVTSDGYVWDFEVATARGHEMVTLNFDGIDDVPAGLHVYLIDEQLGAARNLRQNPSYSFRAISDGGKKALRVVVGSRNYVETNSNDVTLVPAAFDLAQNFPNPFNPETVIRYSLPEAATVTLEIYNMLGQKVRTLVDHTQQAADFYSLNWNGRDDNGKALASGMYLYRLTAGSYVNTRKMVLMK